MVERRPQIVLFQEDAPYILVIQEGAALKTDVFRITSG